MTGAVKRKLIEVALPLDAINKESAREKSIRHGHPSTLHLWWARRPLAACRAVDGHELHPHPGRNLQVVTTEACRPLMPLVARSLEHLDVSHSVATRYSANYVKGPAGVALALTPTCLRHLGTPTWRTLARSQFAVQQCVNVVLAGGVHYRGAGPIEPTTAAWLRT